MQAFSFELLVAAAVLFAAASYRLVYRVSTIRLIYDEYTIAWTYQDKFFCWLAAFEGLLFSGLAINHGITLGLLTAVSTVAVLAGALVGRLLAVSHTTNYRQAVFSANAKREQQMLEARVKFPSQSDTDMESMAAADHAASIAYNNAIDQATQGLRQR